MSTEAHESVSPTWDALRKLGEQCPHPLKVEGECLIVLDSDRRRFTDLGTPEMAQFVLASVNYVRGILPYPAAPVLHDEKDLASYWKAAHDRVVAQNSELSRQIDALQKVGEQCLRPQQTPTGEGERIRGGELELLIAAQAARKAALAHPQQGGERDEAPVWGTAALLRAASINLRWAEDGYSVVLRCKGLGETKKLHDGLKAFAESTPSPSESEAPELSYSGAPMPPDGIEGCVYCGQPFKEGDLVLNEVDGGRGHAACCGPDRESYVGADGDPLKDDEPIPAGYSWTPTSPSKSSGEEA